jgi:hypothetical protein
MQTLIRAAKPPSKSFRPPFSKGGGAWGGAPVTALSFGYFSLGLLPAKKSNN